MWAQQSVTPFCKLQLFGQGFIGACLVQPQMVKVYQQYCAKAYGCQAVSNPNPNKLRCNMTYSMCWTVWEYILHESKFQDHQGNWLRARIDPWPKPSIKQQNLSSHQHVMIFFGHVNFRNGLPSGSLLLPMAQSCM